MRRPASTPPNLPGFDFVKLLGSGGFSDVFLYQQQLPRRQVAVKVLLSEELTPASQRAFVDEANVMAQLSAHPYIVTIYGAAVAEGDKPYFVMEYCAGPSLSDRYKRERFSSVDALQTGVRLSSAIATAHAAGILHRDIKPANVLTNDYGWPALTDFGIASTLEELPVHTTTAGAIADAVGTTGSTGTGSQSVGMSVPWSPPEMFEDDPQPDVRSDVFSLAATIWTLMAGRTPFEVSGRPNGTLDLIGRIERGLVTPLGRDDVPASLIAVLQKGMSVRRADRYQTAIEFARALQRVELELGYAPTTIEVPRIAVEEPAPADSGADETRVRSVSTIAAQPVVAPTPAPGAPGTSAPPASPATWGGAPTQRVTPTAPPAPAAPAVDATQIRGMQTVAPQAPAAVPEGTIVRPRGPVVDAQPGVASGGAAFPGAPGGPATPAQPGIAPAAPGADRPARRIPLAALIAVPAALLVIGAVVAALVIVGPPKADPDPTASPKPSGGSALSGSSVPAPEYLSAEPSADGTSVTFTFAPVDDASGYRWARSEQPDALAPLDGPVVVRDGITPGTRVCVQILAIADGRTSQRTEACYPS
ncbi:serine/threonine-protein kinase [Schumannella sp. 10F1B-5-1]|uniref:serine/threonine-protein kinase n=1 Tax=Schumannella sp. 10F1B-5-1 TaxID=2590780 RepID=UPI001131EE25|nr:serine/threonine-protein kinase [Schumannella sp. 10F1B-5-1]TPW72250.1 protein kinase [Schumannella sp. 10F1B-5-1]